MVTFDGSMVILRMTLGKRNSVMVAQRNTRLMRPHSGTNKIPRQKIAPLLDTRLSSSPLSANSTRHSVTSRIERNSRLFCYLSFSTRHLNATLEKRNNGEKFNTRVRLFAASRSFAKLKIAQTTTVHVCPDQSLDHPGYGSILTSSPSARSIPPLSILIRVIAPEPQQKQLIQSLLFPARLLLPIRAQLPFAQALDNLKLLPRHHVDRSLRFFFFLQIGELPLQDAQTPRSQSLAGFLKQYFAAERAPRQHLLHAIPRHGHLFRDRVHFRAHSHDRGGNRHQPKMLELFKARAKPQHSC